MKKKKNRDSPNNPYPIGHDEWGEVKVHGNIGTKELIKGTVMRGGTMREIKFRAWDKKNKKWTLPLVACSGRTTLVEPFNHRKDTEGNLITVEVMQYTGLRDKNGKEIYEGDLMQISDIGIAEVVYGFHITSKDDWGVEHGTIGFTLKWTGTEDHSELCLRDDMKIIGNIYKNPELLKS